jgi:hypothetical protein
LVFEEQLVRWFEEGRSVRRRNAVCSSFGEQQREGLGRVIWKEILWKESDDEGRVYWRNGCLGQSCVSRDCQVVAVEVKSWMLERAVGRATFESVEFLLLDGELSLRKGRQCGRDIGKRTMGKCQQRSPARYFFSFLSSLEAVWPECEVWW